jgi:hypothetical protein
MLLLAIILAGVAAFVVAMVAIEIAARRRRVAWHRRYFQEGGLIRALMARWTSPPMLTYQPEDKHDPEA